jgi:hypothetical protein
MTPPSESSDPQNAVALNDTVDLMRLLTDGTLFRLLNQPRALAASCGTDCTCNDSMCTCRGTRTPLEAEAMSPAELDTLRNERIEQLRRQLSEVERQLVDAEPRPPRGQSASQKSS